MMVPEDSYKMTTETSTSSNGSLFVKKYIFRQQTSSSLSVVWKIYIIIIIIIKQRVFLWGTNWNIKCN